MLINLIFIIFIIIFINSLKKNRRIYKGSIGEKKVNNILENIADSKLLKDIILKTEEGTTQIDHILIHRKGIFVIETKNFKGWIFGKEKDKYWVQSIYNKKSKFYNPIRQNYGHIKAIKSYLPENRRNILKSIIVFSNNCEFKNLQVTTPVIKMRYLSNYIKYIEGDVRLTNADIDYFYMLLNKNNIMDLEQRKNHVNFVKEKKVEF
ncbi:nuclease-related domain-containing protein [uncultured Clostridium sp.]|uniref:nuclease-related domain-containing protein n=1 Tax=uncultured Clostridium sp. TaxID=59620 RepID=UPI0025909C72|nr:nuclease-related domain-containing protein [uncultured Clostridium sp.]